MVSLKLFEILTLLCIIDQTTAFKCWCCASDESDSDFCGKTLDESNLSHYQKAVNLVDCSYPHFELLKGRDLITKCMIQKTINMGQIVYSRSCAWEERNAQKDACLSHSAPNGHHIKACETCSEDKCNYQLNADSHDGSTSLVALYEIMFVCLLIVVRI